MRKIIIGILLLFTMVFLVGCTKGNTVTGNAVAESSLVSSSELSGSLSAENVREIFLEARQWDWSEPTITVRSGELVRLKVTSKDVTHGIMIPDVGFNLQIDPGKENVGEFTAPQPGKYLYGCSVMCGHGHGAHRGELVVLP